MAEKTVSLLELRKLVRKLDALISEAWMGSGHPASISFADVREHAAAISAMVADDSTSPGAATATQPPKAADTEKQRDAQKRADYQRAAADKAAAFDHSILGLSHIRRGSKP